MIFKRSDLWAYRPLPIDGKFTNFKPIEFACKCGICQNQKIDFIFVKKLQKLREKLDKPIKINSGYRCENHNKSVGGVAGSSHMAGIAADLSCDDMTGPEMYNVAKDIFDSIGVAKDFIHVDDRPGKRLWFYGTLSEKDIII